MKLRKKDKKFTAEIPIFFITGLATFGMVIQNEKSTKEDLLVCFKDLIRPIESHLLEMAHDAGFSNYDLAKISADMITENEDRPDVPN